MSGGNSHQRAMERAAKERMADQITETVLARISQGNTPPEPEDKKVGAGLLRAESPSKAKPIDKAKDNPFNFGDSIGVLALIVAAITMVVTPPFWLKIVLLVASTFGCSVFFRKSHWTHSWRRYWQYGATLLVITVLAFIAVPQLKSQWLSEHPVPVVNTPPSVPAPSPTTTPPKEPPQPTPPTLAPDPVVHIEPEVGSVNSATGQDGVFELRLDNGSVDIDHVEMAQDYFMVLKDKGQIDIIRLVEAVRGRLMPSDVVPLRANQSLQIPVNFNLGGRPLAEKLRNSGYQGPVGARLRITFRRYTDQKDFSMTRVFYVGNDYKTLSAPEKSGIRSAMPGFGGPDLAYALSHIESDKYWVDPIFDVSTTDGKMTVILRAAPNSNKQP